MGICTLLAKELEGSRYEGLWISQEGPGVYLLGDDHEGAGLPAHDQDGASIEPRIRVAVKVINGQLVVAGYFEDGALRPARAPIGPFLLVWFEGIGSLREATSRWKNSLRQT